MKLKEIEQKLISKLDEIIGGSAKIIADPSLDISSVRQKIVLNLSFLSEKIVNKPSINFSVGVKPAFSEYTYRIRISYKDVRNSYDGIYEILELLKNSLNGLVINEEDLTVSPIQLVSIDFVEKTDNAFSVYDLKISFKA